MERLIRDEGERKRLVAFINHQSLPFVATIREGKMRSIEQNRLQWLWANEAAMQRGDTTAIEVQSEWKLNFGIPIIVAENDDFAGIWLIAERNQTYEEQLKLARIVNVTSLMTSKQIYRYLSEVYQHNSERGIELSNPEDLKWGKP